MYCFCGKSKSRLLFKSGSFKIVACAYCGQARTIIPKGVVRKQEYSEEDIRVYIEKEEMFRKLFRRVIKFIKRFVRKGSLFDIGAGVGLFIDEAEKAGFEATGFEPSKVAVHAAKKHFEIILKNTTKKYCAETIVINHVLEHLENPKKTLSNLSCKFLFIGVPNFGSILAKLKKDRWQSLIPEQHRWHFTLSTLDNLVIPFGFVRVGETYENHDRSMHPLWKRPIYAIFDTITLLTGRAEAMLIAYRK